MVVTLGAWSDKIASQSVADDVSEQTAIGPVTGELHEDDLGSDLAA